MIKVFVTGASGNVGSTVVRELQKTEGFKLVGGWCRQVGEDLGVLAGIKPLGILCSADLEEGILSSKPDVIIDFSVTPIQGDNLKTYLKTGVNVVIGTTGFTDAQYEPFKKEVKEKGLRWAAIANYGLGISLVSDFIRKAREHYPFVTITDQHTNTMANAPSGTAAALAKAASAGPKGEVASKEGYPCVMGGEIHGVQVFSQRLPWPGPYSAHEITLARKDEIIRISVQDHTSDIYMDGVMLTARKLGDFPAGSFIQELSEVMGA